MKSATTLLALASTAAGHAIFQDLWVAGKDQAESCVRFPISNSPVTNVQSTDIRCNVNPAKAPGKCAINAGDKVSIEMHQQPHDRACANEAIGGNHFGPVIVYLSKVSNSATDVGSGAWFKISENGYDPTTKTWGTDVLNKNCGKYTFTIPKSLAPGDYLLRAEAIALHTANQPNGAQFYISCYQVTISSSGSATPAGVKLPGAYNANDPGIKVDIWAQNFNQYTIPGPPVANL